MDLIKAGEDDIEILVELWHSLAGEMVQYSEFNELSDSSQETAEEGFRKNLRNDKITVYLIQVEGENIGFLDLKKGEHRSRKISEYTKLVDLFIKQDFRNKGYGSEVIERVKEIARNNGSEYLKVSCEWDNKAARRFYEKNGFEEKQVKYVQKLE